MNANDLLHALEQVDERYIRQAGAARRQAAEKPDDGRQPAVYTDGGLPQAPVPIREGRRSPLWGAAAAALALVLAAASVLLLLQNKRREEATGPNQASPGPGESSLASSTAAPPEASGEPELRGEYNALDLDLDALIARAENARVAEALRDLKDCEPSRKNDMTGFFAGKNLILVEANGFTKELIDPERTPTLYRMATKGIAFTDYYAANYGSGTLAGEFAILSGVAPVKGSLSMQNAPGKELSFSFGSLLRDRGYFTRAYCDDHSYDYYGRNLSYRHWGYEELIGVGNGLEEGLTKCWPYSDREMIDFTLPQYLDKQPFSICYVASSGQGLYSWWANAMSQKHRDEVAALSCSETLKAYYAANLELELAMRDLIAGLTEAGIADDTVIVLAASNYPYALEQNDDYGNAEDYLAEHFGYEPESLIQRDHSALLIWSGCLEGKDLRVTSPSCNLDIAPTLCNLFGLPFDSRLMLGRDVFSDREPLVLWTNGSWKTDKGEYDAASKFAPPTDERPEPTAYERQTSGLVMKKLQLAGALLETNLLDLLFSGTEAAPTADELWLCAPAADPVEAVREALRTQSEKDYTLSLRIEELRLDEAEKQDVLAGSLDSQSALRNGFGLENEAMASMEPEELAVVYARYTAEYDHTKTFWEDGALDQYFYLIRNRDGNWELYAVSYTQTLPTEH
ncbi:MAG: LTA synthase family protein [Oscillospiraceae bacterium]|nr:LTA synthase family protein [Oscillospiraceae bacterium]